uniref:Uncharacterized protein n=1 Tax=Ditylenchus dipsaci TaxID=166011 RepID=A0A915D1D3_9BILA
MFKVHLLEDHHGHHQFAAIHPDFHLQHHHLLDRSFHGSVRHRRRCCVVQSSGLLVDGEDGSHQSGRSWHHRR